MIQPRNERSLALTGAILAALSGLLLPLAAAGQTRLEPAKLEAIVEHGTPFTIDDIVHPPLSREFGPASLIPQTNRSLTVWYRFVAPATNATPFVLREEAQVGDAELYFPRPDGTYGLERFGMRVPYDARPYAATFPAVALTPQMRMGTPLYVRAYGRPSVIWIARQTDFDSFVSSIERWTFCFAGFLFAIGMTSLFMSIYLRERAFVLQAALMAVALLYTLIDSELAWKYLWPGASLDYDLADSIAFLSYLFVLLIFSRTFLSLDRHQRRLDIALWSAFALNVVITFVADPLAPDSSALDTLTPLINFLPFLLLLIAGVVRWRDGFRQARFFTIGLAGMIGIFAGAGILQRYAFARWGFVAGVSFDSLFFQFALADRVLAANRARDEAQRSALEAQAELVETQQASIATLAEHNIAFSRFVPHQFLTLLGRQDIVDVQLGDQVEREMVVLFSDVRSFTALSEELTPQQSFDFINAFLAQVDPVVREHDGFIDKYIGDAVMALFSKADDAVDAAIAIQQQVRRFNEARARELLRPIAVGVGLHRGQLMLGTIGESRRLETTVIGGSVNVASRMERLTKTLGAQIVVSSAVVEAIERRQKYCLRALGAIRVEGLSHDLGTFEVCDADEPELLLAKMGELETFEHGVQTFAAGNFTESLQLFENITQGNPKDFPAEYYRKRVAAAATVSGSPAG